MSYLEGGGPLPANTYPVLAGSVQADPAYDSSASAPIDDFCMLQVAGLPDGVASIPVATCADGLVLGEQVEYVGFGATQTNPNNTARRHGDSTIDEALTSQWFQYSEGDGRSGPCQGDDGGPAVLPAGAPQSTQVVVGTTSYGDLSCNSYGVSMRVSSATCAGGFIAEYLSSGPADAGTDASGVDAGNEAGTADAGTDASRGDAGNEAGTADAGVDASVVDAAADAGAPDAGTPEAAATDSGEDAPAVEAGGEDAGADVGSEDAGEIDAGAEAGLVDATTDAQGAQEAGAPDAVTVQDAQSDGGSSVASDAARPTDARTVSDAGHSGQDARATGTDSGPRRDAARRDSGDAETDAGEASGAGEGGGGCSVSRRPVGHGLAQGLGLGLALLLACGRRRRDGGSGHPSREA
jgi:hypothetical protein